MNKLKYLAFSLLCGSMLVAQPLEKALLWKITGKDIKAPSYLFGTVHMTCDASLSPAVKTALEETAQLYLEIDMDDPMLQWQMASKMMIENNGSIKSMVSADDFKFLDEFFTERLSTSIETLQTIKPMFLLTMLVPQLLDCPMQSVEQELMSISAEQNEPVFGLETVEDQFNAIGAIPLEEQVAELLKSARGNLDKDKAELDKLMEIYQAQDIEGLYALTLESENAMTAKYTADLLDNRNRNWIPVIVEAARQKPTFFGVGAAHLAGNQGVIKLLRKQGYTVTPVK